MQSEPKRHRARWSYSEVDSLHREFENKRYSINVIAQEHERTHSAILYKLKSEGLLHDIDDSDDDESEEEDDSDEDYEEHDSDEEQEHDSDEEQEHDSDEDYEEDDSEEDGNMINVVLEDTVSSDDEASLGMHVTVFSYKAPLFAIKCAVAYCNTINKMVDLIFDASYNLFKRIFNKR